MDPILIHGVPFMALHHHDGRFVRAPGLFAFARRRPCGEYEVLHLELAEAINRVAGPGHDRWLFALAARMDTLLVHLFGVRVALPADALPSTDTVAYHPQALCRLELAAALADAPAHPQSAHA